MGLPNMVVKLQAPTDPNNAPNLAKFKTIYIYIYTHTHSYNNNPKGEAHELDPKTFPYPAP
jgi:hypothetical protein